MSNLSTPQYNRATVVAATPALCGAAGAHRLMRVILFGGSANSQVEFKDAATDTGTVLLSVNALAGTTIDVDLCEVGGIPFATGLFCKPAGTASIAYVWYD